MAIYHHKFGFNGKTNNDYELISAIFDAENGSIDGFLGMQALFNESFDGTKRYDYGAKFSSVASLKVSLIKNDGSDFSLELFRNVAKWLSGHRKVQWLDLYSANNTIEYSFLGRFIDVAPYMNDGKCIGVTGTFEATTPWAHSAIQTTTKSINGQLTMNISNLTDDVETYVYPNIEFVSKSNNGTLSITNNTTGETTTVINLLNNENITINQNQIITSDRTSRVFGDDFNFVFLRLAPGVNQLSISGNGDITISYRYFLKVAHALTDIENTYCSN